MNEKPLRRPLCSRMHGYIQSKRLRKEFMEKYGVEITTEKTKTADGSERKVCPTCGRELEKVDNVYIHKCPSHGTEPFEAPR